MEISQAKSVDALYSRVADFDRVLTTDAPLSLALNRRIDTPRLGRFAATPRMLASGQFRPDDKRTLFLEAIDRTAYDWKLVDHLIENVLGCWEETGDLEAILEYDRFDTQATHDLLDVVAATRSSHGEVAAYTADENESIAVLGEDHFPALDRHVFPSEYEGVSPFNDEETFDMPPFHIFESATAIVDAVVANVDPDDAEHVAVVMDSAGQYPPLIESAFAVADIPFYGGPGFVDDDGIRTYLRLLQVACSSHDVRVQDLKPVLTFLDLTPRIGDEDKRLALVDDPTLEPITAFLDSVESYTFDAAVDVLAERSDASFADLRDELERLGIADESVSESRVNDLAYYLETIDIPADRDDEGVLLADPSSAAFVDRPVVFFLGMDESWTQTVPDRPWIDAEARDQQHLEEFQLLLQNGQEQYYLVQETAGGEAVTPCLYFHDLLDVEFETFGDLPHVRHSRYPLEERTAFDRTPLDVEPERVELLSQSSLNTFANCPRDYQFDRIVDSPERDYFTKGNLIHDFAELCVARPDVADSLDDDEVVDVMVDEIAPFLDDLELDLARTEFEVAVDVIRDFLAADPPQEAEYESYERRWDDNLFADRFDAPVESTITEQSFANEELAAKGKVDLIHAPTRLVDYKTGNQAPTSKLVRQASTDPVDDKPNFQAPMYLAHHRTVAPDSDLEFAFVHVLSVLDDAVTGEVDTEDALVRVQYRPMPFVEFAGTHGAFQDLTQGISEIHDRRKTLERLGFERYRDFFEEHDVPDVTDKDAMLDTDFRDALRTFGVEHVGDYQYVKDGVDSALKTLIGIRNNRFFADDLDAIEAFVHEQRDLMNEYRRTAFPVGDPNEDRLNNRDLIRPE